MLHTPGSTPPCAGGTGGRPSPAAPQPSATAARTGLPTRDRPPQPPWAQELGPGAKRGRAGNEGGKERDERRAARGRSGQHGRRVGGSAASGTPQRQVRKKGDRASRGAAAGGGLSPTVYSRTWLWKFCSRIVTSSASILHSPAAPARNGGRRRRACSCPPGGRRATMASDSAGCSPRAQAAAAGPGGGAGGWFRRSVSDRRARSSRKGGQHRPGSACCVTTQRPRAHRGFAPTARGPGGAGGRRGYLPPGRGKEAWFIFKGCG